MYILIYILLNIVLLYYRTLPYDFHLSSLIGIWEGFQNLNPDFINKGFVVYKEGGYDGQFFYLINQYLSHDDLGVPILDSFSVRFNRIGFPLLTSVFSRILGSQFYPIITLGILHVSHIFSFLMLRKMCKEENRYLANFYLFSPFVINSNLLLLSDSLLCSWMVFLIYFSYKKGFSIFSQEESYNTKFSLLTVFVFVCIASFFPLIKESALSILGMIFILYLYFRYGNKINASLSSGLIFLFPILFYFSFVLYTKFFVEVHPGTYPLSFWNLVDFPFFGFFKSISFAIPNNLSSLARELAKYPIFIFYVLLFLNLTNIKSIRELILFLPILFILFTSAIAEQGYWLTYDNIMRMFTLSIPLVILYKNFKDSYRDYGLLLFGILLLGLLVIRIVWLKKRMLYFLF